MGSEISFSFVVPCLNAEETLQRCIDYLRAQTYPADRTELIVVDNGSTDRTQEIADSSADRLLIDPAATIARLRNIGAACASHEIIVFVDSDCLLAPDWLTRAAEHFRDPEVMMVGCKTHILPDDAGWAARAWKVHLDRSDTDPNPLWLVTRALAVRHSVFEEVCGFDEALQTCEDVALGHAVSQLGRIVSDGALAPVHLKDADTIAELFVKERWRGYDSVRTSMRFLRRQPAAAFGKEGLSLALPFYALCSGLAVLGGLLWAAGGGPFWLLAAAAAAALLPALLMSLSTCRRTGQYRWFAGLFAVYSAYLCARAAALFTLNPPNSRRGGEQ